MSIKLFSLDEKIDFGRNVGSTIREIYQFDPHYLTWLIVCNNEFFVDISDFTNLPKPTPFISKDTVKVGNGKVLSFISKQSVKRNQVEEAMEHLKNGGKLKEADFAFPPSAIKALLEKQSGTYEVPKSCSTSIWKDIGD